MNCFRKFISRRRQPEIVYSDNATYFEATEKKLVHFWNKLLADKEVQAYYSNKGIKWNYFKEYASWQEGYHERSIGIVKSSSHKAIGKSISNINDFHTLLCKTKAIVVNARPLTCVYDEVNTQVLRPIDFTIPEALPGMIPVDVFESYSDYVVPQEEKEFFDSYTTKLALIDEYWKYFQKEYLLVLQERHNRLHKRLRISHKREPSPGM